MATRSAHRILLAALAVCLVLCVAGCKTKLKWRIKPTGEFTYLRTVTKGHLDEDGNKVFKSMPMTQNIIVMPYLKNGLKQGWVKITTPSGTGRKTVHGDRNLGEAAYLIDTRGKVLETKGENRTFPLYDLLFEFPGHGLKKNQTWTALQYLEIKKSIPIEASTTGVKSMVDIIHLETAVNTKYTYRGARKCGKYKCAVIDVSSVFSKTTETADESILGQVEYVREGTIYFITKKGVIYRALYEDAVVKRALDSYSEEMMSEFTDATKTEYRLTEK